jgi:hypothetical protein
MQNAIVGEIKTCKRKEKEDKWAKQVAELGSTIEWTTWNTLEICARTQFTTTWTPTIVIQMADRFHHDFQIVFWANLRKYMGVNLDCTKWSQQHARLQAWAKY